MSQRKINLFHSIHRICLSSWASSWSSWLWESTSLVCHSTPRQLLSAHHQLNQHSAFVSLNSASALFHSSIISVNSFFTSEQTNSILAMLLAWIISIAFCLTWVQALSHCLHFGFIIFDLLFIPRLCWGFPLVFLTFFHAITEINWKLEHLGVPDMLLLSSTSPLTDVWWTNL